jgi:demethylmenaquinone methyltransferase/2-methoxy-6-polyprenyl-1,4-benzoquinol methylase
MNHSGPEPEFIRDLFDNISERYDRANDVITIGLARRWRKELVTWSGAREGQRVLDCATGTGDLAIEFKKAVGETGKVIGIDFSTGMLKLAPEKAKKENIEITFELGDVMNLNYPNEEFDIVSIAYGIRNVQSPLVALKEMARVAKSGGSVMILETGETEIPVMRKMVNFYFEHVVPRLGGWVSGKRDAYEYLQSSSRTFPSGEAFVELMRQSQAFSKLEYRSIMGGASFMYKGIVN